MIRSLLTGIAAFALMTGPALAQDYRDRDDPTVVVYGHHESAPVHIVRGGVIGAGVGAAIGCLVTLPVCGPGAAVGATIGGSAGAVTGAAVSTSQDRYSYRRAPRDDYPPPG
jgi:outer membrane lipoprotein SlyB